ncbi:MAG: hypothetical protein LIR35_02790 [Bacteroidota bacterium]|nr:hypothetical protein [Bacteroidota bacterium]
MDIDLLSKMVKELILDNDEVSLPGVGSFVTEIVPATFSDKGYTINPPYRRLYFRQRQNDNDTAIAELYAKSNNVELGQAVMIIENFLEEMREVLKQKKTIVFPELGRLRATRENNFFFVADEDLDIYPDGFGLEPISLKTHEETPEEVTAAISDLKGLLEPEADPAATEPAAEPAPAPEPEPQPQVEEPIAIEDLQIESEEPAKAPVQTSPTQVADGIAESKPTEKSLPEKDSSPKALVWIIAILAILAFCLITFAILGRLAPDFVDSLLYNAEDLELVRSLR